MTNSSRVLALAFALCVCTPASAQQLWKWSQTPATNATADPAINWATGMAPSAVSPSSRAMMAAVARYRDDTAGRLTTGGTSTAYTVATNTGYGSTPADGTRLSLTFHATNGTGPTLAADGGAAFPLNATTSTSIPAATLVAGSPYDVVFNSSLSVWLVVGVIGSPTAIPLGGVIDFAGTTSPNSNFALAYGQCISRTTYAALFALVSTTFGSCDGTTTFGLPDLRGRVVAGVDNMGGSAANRITVAGGNFDGTVLGAAGGAQSHTLTVAELPVHTPSGSVSGSATGTVNISDPGHSHRIGGGGPSFLAITAGGPTGSLAGSGNVNQYNSTDGATTGITASFSGGSISGTLSGSPIGSGNSHPILQPTMILGKIIRIF